MTVCASNVTSISRAAMIQWHEFRHKTRSCSPSVSENGDMDPGICLRCGNDVEGRVNNIALTLYCLNCIHAEEFLSFEATTPPELCRPWLWWESLARLFMGEQHQDLMALQFELASRRETVPGPMERRYVAAEVRALPRVPRERIETEARLRREERMEKRRSLERVTGLDLRQLNPRVMHDWLGDYLSGSRYSLTTEETVMHRRAVLSRVMDIVDNAKDVRPSDAFAFCLDYPFSGRLEFQELKAKTQLVFRLQGFRILGLLEKREIDRLEGTALHDVFVAYTLRDRPSCIRGYLESMAGRREATTIMKDAQCRQRTEEEIGRNKTDRQIADRLLLLWRERADAPIRRRRLSDALAARGLPLSNDNQHCEAYVNGQGTLFLEEVVGIVATSHALGM